MAGKSASKLDAAAYYEKIAALVKRPVSLMEVCGTHTMAIGRFGLRPRLPGNLHLLAGPGCPVCVTPGETIDRAIKMAGEPGVTVMTFGDMMRVPGSGSTLDHERMLGRDVRIVYSPVEALEYAKNNPSRTVVFIGIGFETTSPAVAATLVRAREQQVDNFAVLPAFKLIPPAMAMLASDKRCDIDGFLCPGHVSAIIGSEAYRQLAEDAGVPCVVTGFEAVDILEGVMMLLEQIRGGCAAVEIQYRRAVPPQGNPTAVELLKRVFRVSDAGWRGIGVIPESGLELAAEFMAFDAKKRVPVEVNAAPDLPDNCSCGEVMKGMIVPPDCPLFGTACVPLHPVGPCMVSSEGACAAYLKYGV
jgi:hydrogenase expression/formation protein HypD